MASRLKLHEELCDLLGTKNVYFQPPESIKLSYPCIIYTRPTGDMAYADDQTYRFVFSYTIQIIDTDPDSELPKKLALHFPMCKMGSRFVSDNLYHDNFTIYY